MESHVTLDEGRMITLSVGEQPLHVVERLVIVETLKENNYNKTHTAKSLKIGIRTLQRKLKKYAEQGLFKDETNHYKSSTVVP